MSSLETLRNALPASAKDIKLNLQAVLQAESLSAAQRWGVAVASAIAARNPQLRAAIIDQAQREVDASVLEDAAAAAALMAMNNVYYRFRHMLEKPSYNDRPAKLRMNRLVNPATNKVDFELFSLAVSAINGCETCVRAHEDVVTKGGLSEDQVNDAVRIASVVHAAAVALEIELPATV
ncbi:MAG TPA: carboxymuconolactone decarboxylase family protein [Polyangiales bacterium]|nr:carboxymuconolactone decarboxylase family protein [Polyangiales bacterium]